jgi:hypothetical protein
MPCRESRMQVTFVEVKIIFETLQVREVHLIACYM